MAVAGGGQATLPMSAGAFKPPTSTTKKDKNQNIQVVVRCRPLDGNEKRSGAYSVLDVCPEKREVSIKERSTVAAPVKTFSFDRVFGAQSKQIELYKTVVVPILEEVLLGYNCTIFAYGQTGSGKTFTMEGEKSEDPNFTWEDDPLTGIIPRALLQLFARLEKQDCEFTVRVSYLEIYNEELIDLLGAESVENPRLKIYEDAVKKGACIVNGLEEVVVNNKEQVYQILQQGRAKRQTAATLMNAHSSRSHSLFTVTIHIKENSVDGEELLKTGKLNLVDLAGSECIGRSGAVDKRAREAGNINQSLLTLGRVISALVDHAPHVPYRESKLTRLLQDSLGGRTKTSIIATISPASSNLEETLSTLEYAHRARNITNKPEINQKLTKKALLKEYTEEIERMRKDLQAARDKNGIFLAEENYNAMHTQLAQQRDAIKEFEDGIAVLKQEVVKMTELFTDTRRELDERTVDLEATSRRLESTSSELRVTATRLGVTTQQRDEQAHLVGEHVRVEGKLSTEANLLLSTADASTSDVTGLHSKLMRLRCVESTNASVQQRFYERFQASVGAMGESLGAFSAEQQRDSAAISASVGGLLARRAGEASQLSATLSRLVEVVSQGMTEVSRGQERHAHGMHKGLDSVAAAVGKQKDSEICRMFEFNERIVIEGVQSILLAHNKLTADLTLLAAKLHQQMTVQEQKTREFFAQQLSSLATHSELVAEFADQQAAAAQQHAKQTEELKISQNKLSMDLAQELSADFTKMLMDAVQKQESHMTSCSSQIVADLAQTEAQCAVYKEKSLSEAAQTTDACMTAQADFLSTGQTHGAESAACIAGLTVSVDSASAQLADLGDELNAFSVKSQEAWSTHAASMTTLIERQKGLVSASMQTCATSTQELERTTAHIVHDMDARQCAEQAALYADLCTELCALDAHGARVADWAGSTDAELGRRLEEVRRFIDEEIVVYVPTGETPQRREFTYPRVLSRTARHSVLLDDFRATYLLEEAINRPIPTGEDSDSDEPDEKQTRDPSLALKFEADAVSGGMGADDRHDTSGDSAISSVSAKSSNHDNVFRSESNKENVRRPSKKTLMKPPPSKPLTSKPSQSSQPSLIPLSATNSRGSQNNVNNVGSAKSTPSKN